MATTKNITMKQFNGTDYDTLYPKTVYNQVSGVAPAGYGLGGKYGFDITGSTGDANNAKYNGWYTTNDSTANLPTKMPHSACKEGTILTAVRGVQVKQTFFDNNYGYIATRLGNADTGAWSEWEYVNPPMTLGVEYRTTERYLGKPVYVKSLSMGNMPAISTTKTVAFGTGTEIAIEVTGRMEYESDTYTIPFDRGDGTYAKIYAHNSQVFLMNGEKSLSAYNVFATVKYIKTTD